MSSSTIQTVSTLGHAILALVGRKPMSGYDLTRLFGETPLSLFSESPGAIYPALRRLEAAGLIRGRVIQGGSLRPRKDFSLTARGRGRLETWLRAPTDPNDVRKRPAELTLRFSFMDQYVDSGVIGAFLDSYIQEHEMFRTELIAYRNAIKRKLSQSGQLALGLELTEVNARIRWARRALSSYQ